VIRVPLDHRPTLGLRGPPKRVIEIERVRCHRHRRPRSVCYEYDYDDPPPPPPPPVQPPIIVANPVANQFLSATQPSMMVPTNNTAAATTSAFLSNLTQESIDNLPRQTVHLPPIHLPGSQADANTELHTVIFPAEIINPVDGTLSIIQANLGMNNGIATNIQPFAATTVQPQLINIPTTVGIPGGQPISPATATDPIMQRFRELFQRLSIPQTQQITPASNPPIIRPTLPNMSQFNPTNNTMNNPPIIPAPNTANVGSYPPANIRPTNALNIGSYRPASVAPMIPRNIPSYRPATIVPSGSVSNMSYRPANITPSGLVNNTSYTPANITPYRSSSFTPSASINNATYRPANITPSNPANVGPYQPANITPYANIANRSNNYPLSQPSFTAGPTSYTSASSAPSASRTPFPRLTSSPSGIGNNSLNPSFSSPSLALTPNQSVNSMPKSILRNATSIGPSNTTYSSFTSPNVMSSNDAVRKTTRFT
jgi:hypothetical protein